MEFQDLNPTMKGKGFAIFDQAEAVLGIVVPGCANYTRKQVDELTEWVKETTNRRKRFGLLHVSRRWQL
jgi:aspartyl-tRNA synthetase